MPDTVQDSSALIDRDPKFRPTDMRVVRAIAQTAVDVELFTIPLYMTSLYSLEGMHAITGKDNDFYRSRLWPGAKARAKPATANEKAFNIIFSVFIQEMLHLQMAANMATAIGLPPSFTTGTGLQDDEHGWTCYGPDKTVIPGIVDLRDTDKYRDVAVDIGPVDQERIRLFLAIEQPREDAEADIVRNRDRYFPTVPFDGGNPDFDPADMKMFGSIGYMYQCYRDYLSIRYADGTTLWDAVFDPDGQQNDLFNSFSFPGHPMREFMGFETTVALTDKEIARRQVFDMMNAITDQGEGSVLKVRLLLAGRAGEQNAVMRRYRPSEVALQADYPSYSDAGAQIPSADAVARYDNSGEDHYGRFREVQDMLGEITTWTTSKKVGNWTASDLHTEDYDPSRNPYGLPTPEQVAAALNNLNKASDSHAVLSLAVVGALKGITTVLDQYWNPQPGKAQPGFPFPSMVGSGDRMSSCWAITGRAPDLSTGLGAPKPGLNHACQGLDLASDGANGCAQPEIFHTCRGSNLCKGQGGCGFVQPSTGGGSCGATKTAGGGCSAVRMKVQGGLRGDPAPGATTYTAPSDNICGGFGGCAVPISASQVYPTTGTMDIYDLAYTGGCGLPVSKKIGTLTFLEGEKVADVAYKAFAQVLQSRGQPVPKQPEPTDLRVAFPPST